MTGIWRLSCSAMLAPLTAGLLLFAGWSSARADELADLKANQELLKQRLDQLALGAPLGVPPPGASSLAGSFPRSFLIPGTNTSLLIGGYVDLYATYWFDGGSPNSNNLAAPPVTGIPGTAGNPLNLHGTGLFAPAFFNAASRGNGVFRMASTDSRLRFETRTPTAWGEVGTVVEFDFFGCTAGQTLCNNDGVSTNPALPRLRLAYGTMGGFEAGQNWLPVNDLAAHADVFDFGGEAGTFGYARTPQIGYTWQLPYGMTFLAALVNPVDQIYTPQGNIEDDSVPGQNGALCAPGGICAVGAAPVLAVNPTKNTYPDVNLVWQWNQPWGHFRLNGVIHPLELEDGAFISKNYIGYGGGFGMNAHPGWFGWAKDNIGAEAWAGSGLGHYGAATGGASNTTANALATNFGGIGSNCYGAELGSAFGCPVAAGLGSTAANAKLVRATTVTSWGGQVNYQHFWLPNLRTNLSTGIQGQDLPTSLLGITPSTFTDYKWLMTAHANLIWSPVAFIDTGIEYVYGHRVTIANAKGDDSNISYVFKVKF
jgi:hypothetical protein